MTRTADDAIRDTLARAAGRTRYEGQEPRDDELMVAEIDRLRARVAELEAREAWLPIETAPISPCDPFTGHGPMIDAWVQRTSKRPIGPSKRVANVAWYWGKHEQGWGYLGTDGGWRTLDGDVLFWRPFPAPPIAPET